MIDNENNYDIIVNIISKYADIFLGCAIINQPFGPDIAKFVAQVFNQMVVFDFTIESNEKLICVCSGKGQKSHIIVVTRQNNSHEITVQNVSNFILGTNHHSDTLDEIPVYGLNFDKTGEISYFSLSKDENGTLLESCEKLCDLVATTFPMENQENVSVTFYELTIE